MSENQLKYLALSAILLGIIGKKAFNDFYIYEIRKMNLRSIDNDYYIGSKRIKEEREKINENVLLKHKDKRVIDNINLFLKEYTKDELLILKKNIENLKVSNEKLDDELSQGAYDLEENKIIASNNAFNHEMHHVASTLGNVDNIMICGFMQNKNVNGRNFGIGMGLNEGYTEYLSMKQTHKDHGYYKKIVNLIPLIELFFDNELDLRKNYFNADLEAVIDRFIPLTNKKEAIELIRDIDKLMFYDCFRTWFDKTDMIDLSIRLRLSDYYERLSGNKNLKELFIPNYLIEDINKAKKLIL